VAEIDDVRNEDATGARWLRAQLGRPWILTILVVSALCVAYVVGIVLNWGDISDRSLLANLGMLPAGLTATFVAWKASGAQTDGRSRRAWRLMTVAFAGFFAGDALFFVYQNLLGITPFPSWADAGYLIYYPFMFAGLLTFPNTIRGSLERLTLYLDGFAVFLGGGMVIGYFFLIPTLSSAGAGTLEYALSAGYPFGDLLLLVGMSYLLFRGGGHRGRASVLLLSAGLLVGMFADVVYGWENIQGTSAAGGISDAGYIVSWLLFAWAGYTELNWAHWERRAASGRGPNWPALLIPAGFATIAMGLLVYSTRGSHMTEDGFLILAAVALFGTTVVRRVMDGVRVSRLQAEVDAAQIETDGPGPGQGGGGER
jgi:diguanylate cyclase